MHACNRQNKTLERRVKEDSADSDRETLLAIYNFPVEMPKMKLVSGEVRGEVTIGTNQKSLCGNTRIDWTPGAPFVQKTLSFEIK